MRKKLGDTGPFLGHGTAECPWIVFDRGAGFYGIYLRGRTVMNVVRDQPDEVVGVL